MGSSGGGTPGEPNALIFALLALYESTGDAGTLDEAISKAGTAVAAADSDHIHRTSCLYGLAYGLFRRGELRRTLLDFDEAAVLAGKWWRPPRKTMNTCARALPFYAQTLCYLPSVAKL